MITPNYLEILLYGFANHKGKYFKDYLIGQVKEHFKKHISKQEFLDILKTKIDECVIKINYYYQKDLKDYNNDQKLPKNERAGYNKPDLKKEGLLTSLLTQNKLKTPECIYLSDFEFMLNVITELKKDRSITEATETISDSKKIKLNWKGQKNQLYNVLRQLKEQELISNTYNELADFIIQNVIPFQSSSKETIEKELKKDKPLPKNKRVKINTLD